MSSDTRLPTVGYKATVSIDNFPESISEDEVKERIWKALRQEFGDRFVGRQVRLYVAEIPVKTRGA